MLASLLDGWGLGLVFGARFLGTRVFVSPFSFFGCVFIERMGLNVLDVRSWVKVGHDEHRLSIEEVGTAHVSHISPSLSTYRPARL